MALKSHWIWRARRYARGGFAARATCFQGAFQGDLAREELGEHADDGHPFYLIAEYANQFDRVLPCFPLRLQAKNPHGNRHPRSR